MNNNFTKILGFDVYNKSFDEVIDEISKHKKVNIISGNPEVLYLGLKNEDIHKSFISENALIIPDGVGTIMASKLVKPVIKEKIAGIDLMKTLLRKCEKEEKSVYLLGTSQETLDTCIVNIKKKHPNLNIVGSRNGFFDLDNAEDIVEDIIDVKPYALFVAIGCPRQEKFILKYIDKIPATIFMGVGGSFDVIAGKVKRAPKWMISLGLEWLYRVFKEPHRIKRLGSIPKFLWLVIRKNKVK